MPLDATFRGFSPTLQIMNHTVTVIIICRLPHAILPYKQLMGEPILRCCKLTGIIYLAKMKFKDSIHLSVNSRAFHNSCLFQGLVPKTVNFKSRTFQDLYKSRHQHVIFGHTTYQLIWYYYYYYHYYCYLSHSYSI